MTKLEKVQRIMGDRNKGEFKQKGDTYVTPAEAIYPILKKLHHLPAWECACGDGAIAEILKREKGKDKVIATDLYDWGYGQSGVDYLTTPPPKGVETIITNPPFSLFNEFLGKAFRDMEGGIKTVLFLAPLRYLSSQKRRKFFSSLYFEGITVFSRRLPRMHAIDYKGKKTTSMMDFAWYKFSAYNSLFPTMEFIDWKEWSS